MRKNNRGFIDKLTRTPGLIVIAIFNKLVVFFGKDKDIISSLSIPFNEVLTQNYKLIKKEFEQVFVSKSLENIEDFYKVDTYIGQDDQWKAYPFIIWNHKFESNLKKCPEVDNLLKEIPGCTSAMFSVLLPGKHILSHKGVYKGVIRCLLTLELKENAVCWIQVNNNKIFFKEGEAIYFDETFEHEVKNESDHIRAVLYLDIYRKLPFPLNILNRTLFYLFSKSPYMQTIIKEYQNLRPSTVSRHKPRRPIQL